MAAILEPQSQETFTFSPGALAALAPAGLDLGHLTAKVAFVERAPEQDRLHCATFPAEQLIEALRFLKSKVKLQNDARLHVTGRHAAGAAAVRDVLGAEAVTAAKLESRIAGAHFLIANVATDELELPRAEATVWDCSGSKMMEKLQEMFDGFKEKMEQMKKEEAEKQTKEEQKEAATTANNFPSVVVTTGNMQTSWFAANEKTAKSVMVSPIGAETLNGLINLMVGSQSFAALEETASRGQVQNVDTVVQEVLSTDPNSPYGRFPPDMPIFPFGKAYDHNKDLTEFAKEDVAASLVRMFAGTSLMDSMGLVMLRGASQIFVGGSLFGLTSARQAWHEYMETFFKMLGAKTTFVKLQHACAVGAMMANEKGELGQLEVQRM